MTVWAIVVLGILATSCVKVDSLSCPGPEWRGTTPCENPKCCESGELTTELCSECSACAPGKDEECGAGFEGYAPNCAKGFSCFTRCPVCATEGPGGEGDPSGKACVFPFKYKGTTYEKCTTTDSDNNKPWCAYDIRPGTEVPQDGKHWGDCNPDCPGGDYECSENDLVNMRGTCVPANQQFIRIARPYAHNFRSGLNDTKPVRKCSEEPAYVHQRIKGGQCYCLPPRKGSEKQEGEGCTKKPVEGDAFIFDSEGPPPPPLPEDDPSLSKGWCYLGGVKDPRYYEPEEHCYDDLQWSETEQKFWSTSACRDVPVGGVPE